ncbi:hypothetical protein VU12_07215 [Desulfobulbus sp. US4]|nr:hypothetical protein [Desulfobulbus sp. US4]
MPNTTLDGAIKETPMSTPAALCSDKANKPAIIPYVTPAATMTILLYDALSNVLNPMPNITVSTATPNILSAINLERNPDRKIRRMTAVTNVHNGLCLTILRMARVNTCPTIHPKSKKQLIHHSK